MSKNDAYYVRKAVDEIDCILSYLDGMTFSELRERPATFDGIVFRMIQMSEHLERVSLTFKEAHPSIEWFYIKGFRNRLVHAYGEVDFGFVETVLYRDIPTLRERLTASIDSIQ